MQTKRDAEQQQKMETILASIRDFIAKAKEAKYDDVKRSFLKKAQTQLDSNATLLQSTPEFAKLGNEISAMESKLVVPLSYKDNQSLTSAKQLLNGAARFTNTSEIETRINQAKEILTPLSQKYPNSPQIAPVNELLQQQQQRLLQLSGSTSSGEGANSEDSGDNDNKTATAELTYQQRSSINYANSQLETAERNVGILEKQAQNERMSLEYLQDYINAAAKNIQRATDELQGLSTEYPQVQSANTKIKHLQSRIQAVIDHKQAGVAAQSNETVEKAVKALEILNQICDAQFSDEKISELENAAGSSNANRNRRYNRYQSSSSGDFVRTKVKELMEGVKLQPNKLRQGFVALVDKVNRLYDEKFASVQAQITQQKDKRNQGPKIFIPAIKAFQDQHKKAKIVLFTFSGQPRDGAIQDQCGHYEDMQEKSERYVQFMHICETIRTSREKTLQTFRDQHIAKARTMVNGDPILQELLDYYAVFGDKFNTVEAALKQLKQDLLSRVEKASAKAAQQGFASFRDKYTAATANRQAMLQNPQQYQGKIIANAKFPVASWTKKGWFLSHGNEMFSYVWDPEMWKLFRAEELEQFKIFRKFRQEIVDKHGLTLENQLDWRYPGLVDIEFVAIIDGTTQYTPVQEITDRYGKVIFTKKLPPIQVVNARVVGLKSRYFTVWIGGTSTSKHLDLSGLPTKK